MKTSYIAFGLIVFGSVATMISSPALWFYALMNLLLASLLLAKDMIINRQRRTISTMSELLLFAKILVEAKGAMSKPKEGVGPWG